MVKMGLDILLLAGLCTVTSGILREFLVDTPHTWQEALDNCKKDFTDLSAIQNPDQHGPIIDKLAHKSYNEAWIGLRRSTNWAWSTGEPVNQFHWRKVMFCATINGDGSWTDEICSTSFNFMCYRDNQGTTEYILYTNSLKWKDAETYCKSRHSELVTIKSQAENQVVKQKANGKKIWIGLFNDPWLWADGANSTYRQWGGSDPDNANGAQGCAVLTPGMADTGCTQSWIFFCCSASTELPISKRCNLINTKKTWSEAQAYCRGMSKDLATIYTDQDRIDLLQLKNGLPDNDYPWIGIYHSKEKWQWTTGETLNYSNWAIANDCATIGADGYWHDKNCGEKAPFICSADMRNVTLVQENKTWDEALQHCRSEYTDLTSIVSKKEARLTALVAENAQSSHVWLGLRQSILGNWFWVNREPLTFQNWSLGQTPQCPRLCAAISTADHVWTPISCDQKLNFICYTDPNLE